MQQRRLPMLRRQLQQQLNEWNHHATAATNIAQQWVQQFGSRMEAAMPDDTHQSVSLNDEHGRRAWEWNTKDDHGRADNSNPHHRSRHTKAICTRVVSMAHQLRRDLTDENEYIRTVHLQLQPQSSEQA